MAPTGPIIDAIALSPLQESHATAVNAQSSGLPTEQKFKVLGDRPLRVLASYRVASGGKYNVDFDSRTQIGETGYIYAPHFEEIPQVLHAKRSVKLKTEQGAEVVLYRGSYLVVEGIDNGSPYATLRLRTPIEGVDEWRIYIKDLEEGCEVIGTEAGNRPQDSQPGETVTNLGRDKADLGPAIKVPGLLNPVHLYSPIDADYAPNFYWYEATHGGTRIPENQEVTFAIIRIARALQEVRDRLGGRAIEITSWYRPPHINRKVGGARYSRHMNGDAVDFKVAGLHPYDVYDELDGWWGSRGGLASSSIFTHIDEREVHARWSYGY